MKCAGREEFFQCPGTYNHMNVFTIIIFVNVQYIDICPRPKLMIVKYRIEHRENTTFYKCGIYKYS